MLTLAMSRTPRRYDAEHSRSRRGVISAQSPSQTSAVRDHDLAKMTAALEMPVSLLSLGERECPVDHRVQVVHIDRTVHSLEIGATPNADRSKCNAATRQ